MLLKKEDIEKFLVFMPDDKEFYLFEKELTKEQRTLAQNNVFYHCFEVIWNKMGIDKETVKMNCLKAVFGIEKVKFWWVYYENAIKPKTSELTKFEAILLIETLIEFWKKLWLGEIVTSREVMSLFNNK